MKARGNDAWANYKKKLYSVKLDTVVDLPIDIMQPIYEGMKIYPKWNRVDG